MKNILLKEGADHGDGDGDDYDNDNDDNEKNNDDNSNENNEKKKKYHQKTKTLFFSCHNFFLQVLQSTHLERFSGFSCGIFINLLQPTDRQLDNKMFGIAHCTLQNAH